MKELYQRYPVTFPFQARGVRQGKMFHQTCVEWLKSENLTIVAENFRFENIGVEVDIIFKDGEEVYYSECKGSYTGNRPGIRRTDTLKKAICNAALLRTQEKCNFILLTSHMPKEGSSSEKMLETAESAGIITRTINVHDNGGW